MIQPKTEMDIAGQGAVPRRRAEVIELRPPDFDRTCAELLRRAAADERPNLLIGIPTGGMHVARSMANSVGGIPILPLTCRRPTSRSRLRKTLVQGLAATMPRLVLDRLRMIEHAMLTARRARSAAPPSPMFDECELAGLRDWFGTAGRNPSVLIVDDAVDSGATLAYVLQAVRRLAPPSARIRSAAISQTTEQPLACPTYVLYYRRLCRFPWSLDARAVGRS